MHLLEISALHNNMDHIQYHNERTEKWSKGIWTGRYSILRSKGLPKQKSSERPD